MHLQWVWIVESKLKKNKAHNPHPFWNLTKLPQHPWYPEHKNYKEKPETSDIKFVVYVHQWSMCFNERVFWCYYIDLIFWCYLLVYFISESILWLYIFLFYSLITIHQLAFVNYFFNVVSSHDGRVLWRENCNARDYFCISYTDF